MTEVFYDISHLTTDRLRELFTSYRKYGWIDYEYYELRGDHSQIQNLSDAEIVLNIQAEHFGNFFVFMIDIKDEEDGVMIGFGLSYHEDYAAYLHLPPRCLKELIEKYALASKATNVENMTVEQFLIAQAKDAPLN